MKLNLTPENLELLLNPAGRPPEFEAARRDTLRRARALGQRLVIVEPPRAAPIASD